MTNTAETTTTTTMAIEAAKKPAAKKPAAKKPATKKPAAKKPATKKPAAKKQPVERKANLFRLRDKSKSIWSAFDGQKGEIVAAMRKLGAAGDKSKGATSASIVAALPKIPSGNIHWHLSKFVAAGVAAKAAA